MPYKKLTLASSLEDNIFVYNNASYVLLGRLMIHLSKQQFFIQIQHSPLLMFDLICISDHLTISRSSECPSKLFPATYNCTHRHLVLSNVWNCFAVVSSSSFILSSTMARTSVVTLVGLPDPLFLSKEPVP